MPQKNVGLFLVASAFWKIPSKLNVWLSCHNLAALPCWQTSLFIVYYLIYLNVLCHVPTTGCNCLK